MAGEQVDATQVGLVKKHMGTSARSRSRPRLNGKLLIHCGRGKGMGSG